MRELPTPQNHRIPQKHRGFRTVFLCVSVWLLCLCGVAVDADGLRDPFTFGPREDMPAATAVILMGVLWDSPQPLAIVGGETVGVGDRVGDWEVVKIQETGIVIQRGDRRETVAIGSNLP